MEQNTKFENWWNSLTEDQIHDFDPKESARLAWDAAKKSPQVSVKGPILVLNRPERDSNQDAIEQDLQNRI